MDSALLSQPAPSHSNTIAASTRQRILFDSLNTNRNETNTYADSERPYTAIEDTSAGQRSNSRRGHGLFGNHAERLAPRTTRIPMLSRTEPTGSQYSPGRSYVQIDMQSLAMENHWGDRAPSSSNEASRERGRTERAHDRRSRRRQEEQPILHERSCSSILKANHLRRKLIALATAGLFFIVVLSIYVAFTASHAKMGRELHILLIFMLLILAIVFCHSFVRFILAVARGPGHRRSHIPSRSGPRGYSEPDQPIPVVLAADEEIMAESAREKLASPPPAYGLWRSSVRINPDLLHWQRVNESSTPRRTPSGKVTNQRPPSYASDDGVDYVVEAQPRSFVPNRGQPGPSRIPEISELP